MLRTLPAVLVLCLATLVFASSASATDDLQNCYGGIPEAPPPLFIAGQPAAVNMCRWGAAGGGPYLGTVSFSSVDPTVVIPPSYTYTPADNQSYTFSFGTYWRAEYRSSPMVVFTVPGRRRLSYTFTDGAGVLGYSTEFNVTVIAADVATPVPTLSTLASAVLAGLLMVVGSVYHGRRAIGLLPPRVG